MHLLAKSSRAIRSYAKSRAADPTTWVSLLLLLPIALAAVLDISVRSWLAMMEAVAVGLALIEWVQLALWRTREDRMARHTLFSFGHPLDRRKVLWILPLILAVFAVELWVAAQFDQPLMVSFGFTALGLSTAVVLWYAWSRPVRVTPEGITVGSGLVAWERIGRVSWQETDDGGAARFHFTGAGHHWFGQNLYVSASREQLDRLEAALPPRLRLADVSVPPELMSR